MNVLIQTLLILLICCNPFFFSTSIGANCSYAIEAAFHNKKELSGKGAGRFTLSKFRDSSADRIEQKVFLELTTPVKDNDQITDDMLQGLPVLLSYLGGTVILQESHIYYPSGKITSKFRVGFNTVENNPCVISHFSVLDNGYLSSTLQRKSGMPIERINYSLNPVEINTHFPLSTEHPEFSTRLVCWIPAASLFHHAEIPLHYPFIKNNLELRFYPYYSKAPPVGATCCIQVNSGDDSRMGNWAFRYWIISNEFSLKIKYILQDPNSYPNIKEPHPPHEASGKGVNYFTQKGRRNTVIEIDSTTPVNSPTKQPGSTDQTNFPFPPEDTCSSISDNATQ